MAREFFSTLPDQYFMRMLRRGGRNEILATFLGLGFLHFYYWRRMNKSITEKDIRLMSDYKKLKNDLKYLHPEVLHPTMKRYDSKHNSKFTFDLEEELKSLYVVHSDESIETKLQQNLSRATFST